VTLAYYAIVTDAEEVGTMAAVLGGQPGLLVTSLTEAPEESVRAVLTEPGVLLRVEAAQHFCEPLVPARGAVWPKSRESTISVMAAAPQTLRGWMLRNLLWQAACGGFLYRVTDVATRNLDLAVHMTVARALGQTVIGIMPFDLRTVLETPALSMTDHIVGEADHRALSLVLGSLTESPTTAGE